MTFIIPLCPDHQLRTYHLWLCMCLPEESVAQDYIVQAIQTRLIVDIPINKEKDWQVDLFPSSNLLLFETKALDFGKVRCDLESVTASCATELRTHLLRGHVVCRNPNQILVRIVLCRIKRKCRLSR